MNDFWTAFGAIIGALACMVTVYELGLRVGYKRAQLSINSEREQNRFSRLYAPMYGFFLHSHITTAIGRCAPYLWQRMQNSWKILVKRGGINKAIKALFDKQELGTSGEVEFGSDFPLDKINDLIRGNEQFADATLLHLIASANRAQYEEAPSASELTSADLALFDHICEQHQKLSRKFTTA
ncbi:MAG: hypothetical protein KME42_26330 [Tildeniella nuda ZEHNDER 1965/U140]|jgi:hypothetical protein|nr:hypothetical protein [Tildeniella nuda ZEHNDER 1965/U140]